MMKNDDPLNWPVVERFQVRGRNEDDPILNVKKRKQPTPSENIYCVDGKRNISPPDQIRYYLDDGTRLFDMCNENVFVSALTDETFWKVSFIENGYQ